VDETSDSLLFRLKDRNDEKAWLRFVQLYMPLLMFWARKAGLQDQDAADLVVTLNKWRDFRRRRALPISDADPLDAIAPGQSTVFWEREYRQRLVAAAIWMMQSQFEETTWKAFWGTTVDGRRAADVASELNISEGAVFIAKSRVLKRLREELAGFWD
jgi:RNA polymerase sigma-70 factor (ECF subfamily)